MIASGLYIRAGSENQDAPESLEPTKPGRRPGQSDRHRVERWKTCGDQWIGRTADRLSATRPRSFAAAAGEEDDRPDVPSQPPKGAAPKK